MIRVGVNAGGFRQLHVEIDGDTAAIRVDRMDPVIAVRPVKSQIKIPHAITRGLFAVAACSRISRYGQFVAGPRVEIDRATWCEIGRASCRERGWIWVVGVAFTKKR